MCFAILQCNGLKVVAEAIRCCVIHFSIIDWNNPVIINKMYKVYLGDIPLKTKVG